MSYSTISKVLLVGAIAAGLTACGPSKVDQCNSLITPMNKDKAVTEKYTQATADVGKKFGPAGQSKDGDKTQLLFKEYAETTRNFIKDLESINKEVGGVALKDETLVGFRNQYTQIQTSINQDFQELTAVLDTMGKVKLDTPEGVAEFEKALKALDTSDSKSTALNKQESDIVDKINAYCTAK